MITTIAVACGSVHAQSVGKIDVSPQAEEPGQQQTAFDSNSTQAQLDRTITRQPAARVTIGTPANQSATQASDHNAGQANWQRDQQGERYEARRANYDQTASGVTLEQALVKKLTMANDAQVELAKMIKGKTDNEQVKELASTLIDDHKALNKKLSDIDKQAKKQDGNNANQSNQQAPKIPDAFCAIGERACDNALEMTKQMLSEK
ncbi:MAG: DUF4142 domain-containing protein, partial [Planctomycetota bacterium]